MILNRPELQADVLNYKAKFYRKTGRFNANKEIFGNGVTNSQGAQWKRQRKILGPTFKFSVMRESIVLVKGIALQTFEAWNRYGEIEDLADDCMNMCLAITTQLLFGGNFVEEFVLKYQTHPYNVFKQFSARLS